MTDQKKISILCPCFNEEENIVPICSAIMQEMEVNLPEYDYELIFLDNHSTDNTKPLIRELCRQHKKVKAIFNAKNFYANSGVHGLMQTTGDCTINIASDFQCPVDMIHQFVREWEKGYKVVCGVKIQSKENPIMYGLRTLYYKLIKKMSTVEQIEHFTGFALYDKSFIDIIRNIKDPYPYLRGFVAEYAFQRKDIEYVQPKRRGGKSKMNFSSLFNTAMNGFTSYTKTGLRIASIGGFISAVVCLVIALIYLVLKLIYWYKFPTGIAPILIGVFFIGSLQMFFIGLLGEYVMNINIRVMNRPLVIEEERIGFDDDEDTSGSTELNR